MVFKCQARVHQRLDMARLLNVALIQTHRHTRAHVHVHTHTPLPNTVHPSRAHQCARDPLKGKAQFHEGHRTQFHIPAPGSPLRLCICLFSPSACSNLQPPFCLTLAHRQSWLQLGKLCVPSSLSMLRVQASGHIAY